MKERVAGSANIHQEKIAPGVLLHVKHEAAIEVLDLVKRYPKAQANAVDGILFAVERGEIFGLLGPNGAGKTTTIGILTTSVFPSGGSAKIMGIDIAKNPVRVKQRIAVVPQHSNLDKRLRARELLTYHASYHAIPRSIREARADTLLSELGLAERGKDMVQNYSGGMAQRLLLARALMHNPTILFLDEPTNGLDPQSRLFLWERVRTLNKQGMTIVLTTHDMDEAEQLCTRIAIMDYGRIIALDTLDELKKRIPGGTTLELSIGISTTIYENFRPFSAHILEELRTLPGVLKVEEFPIQTNAESQPENLLLRLYAEDTEAIAAPAIQIAITSGAILRDLRLTKPGLEDVFIALTGRTLRS